MSRNTIVGVVANLMLVALMFALLGYLVTQSTDWLIVLIVGTLATAIVWRRLPTG